VGKSQFIPRLDIRRIDLEDIFIFDDCFFEFIFREIFFSPSPVALFLCFLTATDQRDGNKEGILKK